MGRKIIYGRSQGSGTDRPSEPKVKLVIKKGHGHVRVLIPRNVGVEVGARAHLWFSEEHAHFGVSFEEGGRLKVHGPSRGCGSLFIHGSVDDESFEMLKGHSWKFSDVERETRSFGNIVLPTETTGITFVGKKGSTPISGPMIRKRKVKNGEAASD